MIYLKTFWVTLIGLGCFVLAISTAFLPKDFDNIPKINLSDNKLRLFEKQVELVRIDYLENSYYIRGNFNMFTDFNTIEKLIREKYPNREIISIDYLPEIIDDQFKYIVNFTN